MADSTQSALRHDVVSHSLLSHI